MSGPAETAPSFVRRLFRSRDIPIVAHAPKEYHAKLAVHVLVMAVKWLRALKAGDQHEFLRM